MGAHTRVLMLLAACLLCVSAAGAASAGEAGVQAGSIDELRALMKAGDYPAARALALDLIDSDLENAAAYNILSQVYLTEEKGAAAADAAGRAVGIEPSVADYRLWLARAYLLRASQSTLLSLWYAWKGKAQYEKAVELDPDNVQMRLELCLYYLLAPRIAGGSEGKAEDEAAEIDRRSPLFGAYAWASVFEKQRETGRAEESLMHAVELDTTSTQQAKYALGYFYQRNRLYDDARGVFEDILSQNPGDMTATYYIGTTYLLEQEDLDKAEEAFTAYLDSEPRPDQPTHAMAHWRLGMVYELKGDHDLALSHFEQAVELAPNNREFRSALEAARKEQK
jgi:tetratricopeptide (TPR) repeat protein